MIEKAPMAIANPDNMMVYQRDADHEYYMKQFKGWKSPEEVDRIIKQSAEMLSDKHTREVQQARQQALREVGEWLRCPTCGSVNIVYKDNRLVCEVCG